MGKDQEKSLKKSQKHKNRDKTRIIENCPNLILSNIKPKTLQQEKFVSSYELEKFVNDKHFLIHGSAGTGKTFLSLYLALKEILYDKSCPYKKIIIVRSAVPSRDIGFLPGSLKEKTEVYEEPYREICNELLSDGKGYDLLKSRFLLEFTTSSYLRGISFKNAIVIVDELQNATFQECDTIITRAGENCKMIFCGDIRQTDLCKKHEVSGAPKFIKILSKMRNFISIEFGIEDIVRSKIVKEYITTKYDIEDSENNNPINSLENDDNSSTNHFGKISNILDINSLPKFLVDSRA